MKNILLLITFFAFSGIVNVNAQCITGNCFEGRGTFRYENGDEYDGLWLGGLPHGQGKYSWKNGDFYRGNWSDGVMEGRGFLQFSNGDKYVGQWKENKMHGRGHYIWRNAGDVMTDSKYEGYWEDGVIKDPEIQVVGEPMQNEIDKK